MTAYYDLWGVCTVHLRGYTVYSRVEIVQDVISVMAAYYDLW